jgi:hypothetical protein
MKPSKDFSTRYQAAKQWRDDVRPRIEEAFRFCAPDRRDDFSVSRIGPVKRTNDDTDTFTSLGEELATDLGGDFVTYYMPSTERWFEYEVTIPVAKEQVKAVEKLVGDREDTLWDVIQATNLNDIAPALHFETAVHGTPALWVDISHIQQPIYCEVVPPHQLLITPGHLGILDRFREMPVYSSTLKALFVSVPEVSLTDSDLIRKMDKPGATSIVCWGFWVDWTDPGNPKWRCEITVDGKRVTPAEPLTLGPLAGSCPLLVGRFNPRTGRPWGRGPGIKALPDFRTLDELSDVVLSGLDQNISRTIIYPDDGFIDLSEGVQAGKAYPAHRGFTREQIYEFPANVNVDQGFFTEDRFEEKLRRQFYQDGPRQRGDTPPTAAQWLDERRRVQQRLGKPSAPIWSELILPMIQRFEKLAVDLGRVDQAITHNGQAITVTPLSPLQKAQNQDKVMVTRSNLDLAFTLLGAEQIPTYIDVPTTLENVRKASGDELLAINEEPQVAPQQTPAPAQ